TAKRSITLAADEQRRPRLLHGLGLERDGGEVEELAPVLDLGLGPQALADVERLVQTPAARLEVEARGDPFLFEPARADPDLSAAVGHDVERLDRPCRDEGMAQGEVVDVGAEADAF